MIEVYLGLPGSGKSLHAVGKKIIPALKQGRLVVTNMPLLLRGLRVECGEFIDKLLVVLTEEDLGRIPFSDAEDFTQYDQWRADGDKGQGPLFVIDECHECFADCVGQHARAHPIVRWFAKHRHTGSDVLLMTQEEIGVPRPIRGRVEIFHKFIRKGFLGADNKFRMNSYDNAGVKLPISDDGAYNTNWFKCYRSHVPGASEVRQKRATIWGAWQFKIIAVIALALIGWLIYAFTFGDVRMPGTKAPEKSKATSSKKLPESAPSVSSSSVPADAATTQQLRALDEQIALEQRKRALARVLAGCDEGATAPGSGIVGGFVGAAGVNKSPCATGQTYRHQYDQAAVKIVGHMFMSGRHTYWLQFRRDGRQWVERENVLEFFGLDLVALDECSAVLRGDHGVYKINCEGFNVIGDAEDQAAEHAKSTSAEVPSDLKYQN